VTKYLEILFRHRLRFLILLVLLPVEIAAAVVLIFPHDTAQASLWTDSPAYFGISASVTGWNQYLTPAQNTVDAMSQLTSTNAFYKSLSDSLDASGTQLSVGEREAVWSGFATDMKISASGSHLVVLNYVCSRKLICLNVLSSTVAVYRSWLSVQQQAQAKVALDFYTGQLATAQTQLAADQTALNRYMTANPGTKPADAVVNPEFNQLLRTVTDDQAQVNSLQSKLSGLQLTNAATAEIDNTILSVVDPPRITGGQLSSLPRKQLVIAEVAALAVAFAVLVVMAWSDRNVRDPKELQARLKIPVVATIPDLASIVVPRRA
jgi:hypothetical protein